MAAAAIALLLFGLASSIGFAQDRVVSAVNATSRHVKRWGGVVLILVGTWTLSLALFADLFERIFPV